jgi:hypothetical protein
MEARRQSVSLPKPERECAASPAVRASRRVRLRRIAPQHEAVLLMALRKSLILRRLAKRGLEGRTAFVQRYGIVLASLAHDYTQDLAGIQAAVLFDPRALRPDGAV